MNNHKAINSYPRPLGVSIHERELPQRSVGRSAVTWSRRRAAALPPYKLCSVVIGSGVRTLLQMLV